ncbi:MAG: capsular polysaccharide biosynthesis protein CapF [Clostridia bacterium]|nr:capsular polysaccharide biosynthesis protein CapF [Clostridia bacterium]
MKILITGAKGFVGKNLVAELGNIRDGKDRSYKLDFTPEVLEYDIDSDPALLDEYCSQCDFVFNLAGVNRPENTEDFMNGNYGFASRLLETLEKHENRCPVMLSSSTQAALDNPYGRSKKAGEDLFFDYSARTGARVLVYRFPNIFGKWCRPNYNSAVATFCNNIANGLPIQVNDRNHPMTLVYIDDVVDELIHALCGNETRQGKYCRVPVEHNITLGEIVDLIYSFKESRENKYVPDMTDGSFSKKLYSTYLSYLPTDGFSYPLKTNSDERGSFTEILKTVNNGQFSVNISKPHITKGEHWHHTKNEKFLVVHGRGVIRFRKIDSDEITEYYVSGDKLEVVDIPTGYTHNIENLGDDDMVTFMWANECFNPDRPDTFFLKVDDSGEH